MSMGSEHRLAGWQVVAMDRMPSKRRGVPGLLGSTFT